MASSFTSSPRHGNDADLDDNDLSDYDDDFMFRGHGSDEETDDASETDEAKREEFTEIKEQVYQQKLAQFKKQLQQLKEGTLPEYMKKLKKIEQQYKERLRVNEIWYGYELEMVEREYVQEKKASAKDFEEKKIDLKDCSITELEDKKRAIEGERSSMELTGDSMEVKPITTRKLRRRPNDPAPMPDTKRRKPSPAPQLNYALEEEEIAEDLKIINKVSGKPFNRRLPSASAPIVPVSASNPDIIYDARIDDGRLYYDKKWFHRGQSVFVESKEAGKVSAVITAVGTQEIWLRRTSDNGKLKVHVSQLQKGKYVLRKRTS